GVVWPGHLLFAVAVGVSVIAVAARVGVATKLMRGPIASGTTAGGLIVLGGLGLTLAAFSAYAGLDWQLLAAIGLAAVAAVLYARWTLVVAVAMAALALPDCVDLPWWAPSTVDLVAAAALAVVAVRRRPDP